MPPNYYSGPTSPAEGAFAVVADTIFSVPTRGLYVGAAGNVTVQHIDGSIATYAGVLAGAILPVRATKVIAATTTATSLVGMY